MDARSKVAYLKQTTTGRIYPYSQFIADRPDMEPHTSGDEAPADEAPADEAPGSPPSDRLGIIRAVIAKIPIEEYGKATMGRLSLPKVAQVSEMAGFKVSAAEIQAVITEGVE